MTSITENKTFLSKGDVPCPSEILPVNSDVRGKKVENTSQKGLP